jgi:hypothetical protein
MNWWLEVEHICVASLSKHFGFNVAVRIGSQGK